MVLRTQGEIYSVASEHLYVRHCSRHWGVSSEQRVMSWLLDLPAQSGIPAEAREKEGGF